MVLKFNGQEFTTDDDLKITSLGVLPSKEIKNKRLKEIFLQKYGRSFLGADDLVPYAQSLVSGGMDFEQLENEILGDILDPEKEDLREIEFKKSATGIARGHSLGGLPVIALGITGTKMIDSGLTGLVYSRSLATSSRRRETTASEISVPKILTKPEYQTILHEYLKISKEVLDMAHVFKEKFGKLGGVETFNKVIPYNNPANLFYTVPLDSLTTLKFETEADQQNKNGNFVPREIHSLTESFFDLTKKNGMDIMFNQRIQVPRDTYLHYTVFTDPNSSSYIGDLIQTHGLKISPKIIESNNYASAGFRKGLKQLEQILKEAHETFDPELLLEKSKQAMFELREFSANYNSSINVKILDSLSWRVWSEQKRHATLRQNVESVYSGVNRAYELIEPFWSIVKSANSENDFKRLEKILPELEKNIIIDNKLKKKPEIILPYIYHTAKQLIFYGKMIDNGFEPRDALYIAPRNIRLRTLENYDLINLIDLELPLRLCSTCEPERNASSWRKRRAIAEEVPELEFFLKPKCSVGFCTERKYCNNILEMRDYDKELHKQVKQHMLKK
ncbi:MAG: hypothetical protein KJ949_01700 [Nanoarchaeota archaeon]|nr:hypothetical protein [Nanoarchaeota archaeon]